MQTLERIRILDPETIAQIAAGEVIERPMSVVKELVENSLDAGATRIAVELRDGGQSEIIVADDGRGIAPEDLPLALHRHGTSKLTAAQDLFAVRTLGFRGEGLASIAAAAGTMELISRAAGQDFGARITVRAGAPSPVARIAASPGTKAIVKELFVQTPVRRDFLGSAKSEFARVSAFLSRIALGWPRVSFSLRHEGKDVWSLPAAQSPVDRLEMVFGRGSRGSLVAVSASPNTNVGVGGFTSRVGTDRPNRQGQVVFINGRLVRNPALSAAWSTAYANKLMTSRYPYGVLMLSLPPGDVDVNVHPTKIEVRFVSAAAVFDAVRTALKDALHEQAAPLHEPSSGWSPSFPAPANAASPAEGYSLLDAASQGAAQSADVRALGQIDQTFVVVSDQRELFILDQHAAHERVAFEALQARAGAAAANAPSAPLLVPRIVELNVDQIAALETYHQELEAMGVVVEPFGEGAYRINALPGGYGERRFDLAGMLDDLAESEGRGQHAASATFASGERNRVFASVACHSVVRAHEPLSLQEQVTLYHRLRACNDPQTCPHGRPTMLRFDALTLAKAFRRT